MKDAFGKSFEKRVKSFNLTNAGYIPEMGSQAILSRATLLIEVWSRFTQAAHSLQAFER